MEHGTRAIAAVFADRDAARRALSQLHEGAFPEPWMATTQPATAEKPQSNDVAETSDGVLGTIGRFFTGEGNSLRRSLVDHGIDPDDAAAIDEALAPLESVVTVFVDEREDTAAGILTGAGGRLAPDAAGGAGRTAPSPAARAGRTGDVPDRPDDAGTERSLVVVDTTFAPPMIGEQIFTEHRPPTIVPAAREPSTTADGEPEARGLNDML